MTNDELIDGESWEGWSEVSSVVREDEPLPPVYDLEERTARFGEAIVDFCAVIPLGPRTNRLVDQLTGCGTSLGGNYCEADDALSKKDFVKIIGICRKEARETKFFLRMIARACPDLKSQARRLWQEASELHLIFSKIRRTTVLGMK
ncbi:MAG TPA: four helix bundle protein [Chthoniobacteraceae bacterium]|jgi:four helix bundle protein|nr:four helix bundle protein [Chthoniobacteraceae bacterium]